MNKIPHILALAVDGGGTRCRVAAWTGNKSVAVETGSANVSTDFDTAVHEVLRGLDVLASRMNCPVNVLTVAPAFVGLAGVTGPAIANRLQAALPFLQVRIEDDRVAAVRGVLGHRDGVVGHCGTGSFYASQTGDTIRLSGGWGPVLGDEASAQWVGRLALQLTLQTVDARVDPSPLSVRLLADFEDAAGIVRFASTARPSEFGALAPLVTEHAAHKDAIALRIMQQGADEIARGLRKVGWRAGQVVCLTGGIGPHYIDHLPADLRTHIADREGEPLDGALALARAFAQEVSNERN